MVKNYMRRRPAPTFSTIHFSYDTVDSIKIENDDKKLQQLLKHNPVYKAWYQDMHECDSGWNSWHNDTSNKQFRDFIN